MSKKIIVFLVFFSPKIYLSAQERCGTPDYFSIFKNTATLNAAEEKLQIQIIHNKNSLQQRTVITIPVVVHLVYNKDEENIPDAQIMAQIDALNRDFRRRNADTTQTPGVWKSIASDIGIEFCLAKKDTSGVTTTGITRTKTSKIFIEFESVKHSNTGGQDGWSPQKYLNIWVAPVNNNLFGLAHFPAQLATDPGGDGVVINYKAFGVSSNNLPAFNLGRTTVHEVGHWLNLLHTWGNNSSLTCDSDFVDDTPPTHAATFGCATFPKRDDCTFGGNGIMFMNYMDYGNDTCLNLFTSGQKERMLAALNLYRQAILTSNACNPTADNDIPAFAFSVSPNPVSDGFVHCNFDKFIREGTVSVFDLAGKRILMQKIYASYQQTLSLPPLNDGLYFVQLVTDKGNATVKLILSK